MSDPIIILGGGVAGAAAAILLARAGRPVLLVEQYRSARHKVCGEFLSTEACASLALVGIDVSRLGAASVDTVRLAGRAAPVQAKLPFLALSLTRRTLDEALLRLAAEAGVTLLRGVRAETILPDLSEARGTGPTGWRVTLSNGDSIGTPSLFVATGKHDVRGHPRPRSQRSRLIAFKQYFRLADEQQRALSGAVELILFRGGYAGLQMVEDGRANLSFLIEEHRLRELGGGGPRLFQALAVAEPHLGTRLAGAEPFLAQPLALSHIPYGFLARPDPTFWRLGDQAAVIPSFTGDGVAIALHSARVATACYLAGGSPQDAIVQLRRDIQGSMQRADLLAFLLLHRATQPAAIRVTTMFPRLLPLLASATRIPPGAQRRLLDGSASGHLPLAHTIDRDEAAT